jgi:hypothetical protein
LQLNYNGNTIALPFNLSILKRAAGTRQILNNVQLPEGVSFYNIYGASFDTPFDVWYVKKNDLWRFLVWEVNHLEEAGTMLCILYRH